MVGRSEKDLNFFKWIEKLMDEISIDKRYHALPVGFDATTRDGALIFKSTKKENTRIRIDEESLRVYYNAYSQNNVDVITTINLAKNYIIKMLELWTQSN